MNIKEAIEKRRTIRKFKQDAVPHETLRELVRLAALSASGVNMQPIKYAIIDSPELLEAIFPLTKWAGAEPLAGPSENEQPTAYIAIIGDGSLNPQKHENEAGLVMSTLCLAAMGEGIASCILGAIDREKINSLLHLNENMNTLYLVALGYSAQESKAVEMQDGNIKYYLENGSLCVPKRKLNEIILEV